MEYSELLNRKRELQNCILEYIDSQENIDDYFTNLSKLIIEQQIQENPDSLKSLLYLLNTISNDYHRPPDFFEKIDKILIHLKPKIKQSFSNSELFKIFSSNKRNLLLLIQEKIIEIDESIQNLMTSKTFSKKNFTSYFYPELKGSLPSSEFKMDEINENNLQLFEENRKIGENEKFICKLIRNDSIEEFIQFINQHNVSLSITIPSSIFETNSYLLENNPTLIEYAAFYGSIQIFNYLRLNKCEMKKSIYFYAIHGNNAEIFQCIEDEKFYISLLPRAIHFIEAVKCHHNNIADFIYSNDLNTEKFSSLLGFSSMFMNFMNYSYFPEDIFNEYVFYYLCKYDQTELVNFVLNDPNYTKYINLNNRVILKLKNYKKYSFKLILVC